MSLLGTFEKQPAERESYTITYEDALTDGDNVESSVVTCAPAGLTIDSNVDDPRVRVWAAGGTDKTTYKITVRTSTADGKVYEDEFKIKVKEL